MNFTKNKNLKTLTKHFKSGIKTAGKGQLGLELEHFLVKKDTLENIPYYGDSGVEAVLRELAPYYSGKLLSDESHLIALSRDKVLLSLEPGGQLEISMGEAECISELEGLYAQFLLEITPILERRGLRLATLGYMPKSKASDMPLIPKGRYRLMDEYFKKTGKHGINMMRGSAATQVSIDYFSEEDFEKKFRLAGILSAIFSYLTDNCPMYEGTPANRAMIRTMIWDSVDDDRSKLVAGSVSDKKFGFKKYAEYILKSPAVLVMDKSGKAVPTGSTPIESIYANKAISEAEAEHVLSMFFPYVRLKKYIEIRMADSVPIEYALSLVSVIKGIFYSENNILNLLSDFSHVTDEDVKDAFLRLTADGFRAEVYGIDANFLYAKLFALAERGLKPSEWKYIEPLKSLWNEGKTLAEKHADETIRQADNEDLT